MPDDTHTHAHTNRHIHNISIDGWSACLPHLSLPPAEERDGEVERGSSGRQGHQMRRETAGRNNMRVDMRNEKKDTEKVRQDYSPGDGHMLVSSPSADTRLCSQAHGCH